MSQKKKPWKKNLYENTSYPDNYTDKTFLEELKKNVHITNITFIEAVLGAGRVTQELSCVISFTLVFVYLHNNWIGPEYIFFRSSLLTFLGYVIYRILNLKFLKRAIFEDIMTVTTFLIFGYILSPVLHTLTDSISTDTIYSTTGFMMGIHLVFFDYGISAAIVSSSLSLNAAIFGSICLASRLSSPFHAFVLLTIAVEYFALLPLLITNLNSQYPTILSAIVTIYALSTVSSTLTVIFILVLLFINILCPYWFVIWQNHKDNIYGPWDEAIVHDSDSMEDLINSSN